jgi:hypothetical protein
MLFTGAQTPHTFDLFASPPLNGVISAYDNGSRSGPQQPRKTKQNTSSKQGRESVTIQHPMIILEVLIVAFADCTQASSDRCACLLQG